MVKKNEPGLGAQTLELMNVKDGFVLEDTNLLGHRMLL